MKPIKTNHMEYQSGMEVTDSDMMERVLEKAAAFHPENYTKEQVRKALQSEIRTEEDFGALLSPAAETHLEEMARVAQYETSRYFGNSVSLFTPLYLANYCENHCLYCGFSCRNKIRRSILSPEEIDKEAYAIAQTGLKEILLLTGECRNVSDVAYIGEAIQIVKRYFSVIGIEIYPLNTEEYRYLQTCGADFVSVYQETYDTDLYDHMHPFGPKRSFPYRFYAQERAISSGMRGVAFGSLLGLGRFRMDAYAAGIHAFLLQKKYPHAEISFSFPRLRPYINYESDSPDGISERELLLVMLAYRLFLPFAGITISTRERAGFRDHVVGMAATKISAGVSVGVGGHSEKSKGDGQFILSDTRSVDEIRNRIVQKGLQPVFHDYVRV